MLTCLVVIVCLSCQPPGQGWLGHRCNPWHIAGSQYLLTARLAVFLSLKRQLYPNNGLGKKTFTVTLDSSLSHPTTSLSANPIDSSFRIYLESHLFPTITLVQPPPPLAWSTATASLWSPCFHPCPLRSIFPTWLLGKSSQNTPVAFCVRETKSQSPYSGPQGSLPPASVSSTPPTTFLLLSPSLRAMKTCVVP